MPRPQAILYGSEARGDARPDSDIDLLLLVDKPKLSIKEEEAILAPLYDIELDTGVLINARVITQNEWDNRPIVSPFYINVVNEGIQHRCLIRLQSLLCLKVSTTSSSSIKIQLEIKNHAAITLVLYQEPVENLKEMFRKQKKHLEHTWKKTIFA